MKPKHFRGLLAALAAVLLAVVFAACGSTPSASPASTPTPTPPTPTQTPTPSPTPTATPGTPQVSELTASAPGLGTFVFTWNSNRTSISKLVITFSQFLCGSFTYNLTNETTFQSDAPPITAGQFTISLNADRLPPGIDSLTIHGIFDGSGTRASGTWNVVSFGTSCRSGTWMA